MIVSAWESGHRILVAWLVCLAWAILALVGLATRVKGRVITAAVQTGERSNARDYAHLLAALEDEQREQ